MLGKRRSLINSQNGFTLVELMVVLVILGIILAIGVPNYVKIQAQAEYEADEATLKDLATQVEMYAVRTNDYSDKKITDLTDENNKIINDVTLNRMNDGSGKSVRNEEEKKLSEMAGAAVFEFDMKTCCIDDAKFKELIITLIGNPPVD
jgi:prepilin-type N-terminal cleavage/methylation domain-containing protein